MDELAQKDILSSETGFAEDADEFPTMEFVIKVMTFNMKYGTPGDQYPQWGARKDIVIDMIREYCPDVIGTQEGFRFQLDDISAALPNYDYLGVGRDDGLEEGEHAAIFYRVDKMIPREYGNFWLSDNPQIPGSNTWRGNCRRIVTWVLFSSLEKGVDFCLFNAHFDFNEEIKTKSAHLVNRMIRRFGIKAPVILVGDLNCTEHSPTFKYLRRNFEDSWSASGNHYGVGTVHGFTGKASYMIDWILYRGDMKATKAEIGTFNVDGRYPSDHFPVIAELRITPKNLVAQLLFWQNEAQKLGIDPLKVVPEAGTESTHDEIGRELDIREKIQILKSKTKCHLK
ncbi:MAG: endonuclease/exonuclease/phosphatase family protein [Candidatus Bathyarchaeia archaeon]